MASFHRFFFEIGVFGGKSVFGVEGNEWRGTRLNLVRPRSERSDPILPKEMEKNLGL